VRRSLVLRANPSVRQTHAILTRLELALTERGATTEREPAGELTFRMPPPWRFARVGWLALITSGTATLSAWGGGPWRVSYKLRFGGLQALTGAFSLILAAVGWGWPRFALLSTLFALWIVGYAPLHFLAAHRFRNLLSTVMADVIERRAHPRPQPANARATSQQPE
jgi:hypothetical protein